MEKYIKHGISLFSILIVFFSLLGTQPSTPRLFTDRLTYSIDDEKLEIIVTTNLKSARNKYNIYDGIYLYDLNYKRLYIFYDKDNYLGYDYYDEEIGWKFIETKYSVIQKIAKDDYFIINIDRQYIKTDEIKLLWIYLIGGKNHGIYITNFDPNILPYDFENMEAGSLGKVFHLLK